MIRKLSFYFCLSYIFWLLLHWPFGADRIINLQWFLIGIPVAFLVTLLFGEVFSREPDYKIFQVKRYLWFLYYILVFTYHCILANLDVAYRVLSPKMPINPGIVKVKTSLKSRAGLTALANSIALTPGTLTVDLTKDGYLYIHWINVRAQDIEKTSELIVKPFENILKRIFD
jgi:multicomponent Na+:H+ antiporter subunit E